MGEWGSAILFGATLLAFVLGVSSIIMGFLPQAETQSGGTSSNSSGMKEKIEYGFFGFSAIVIGVLFLVALNW